MIQFQIIPSIFVFFFGAIIGSFLNVVILRYRSGKTLGGRSMCFSCGKTLTWMELIPIGSFFSQGGKCLGCKAKISWQYPTVEILSGIIFVALYSRFGYLLIMKPVLFAILFVYFAFISSLLVVLSVYDLKHKILPDPLVALFSSIAFVGMFFITGDAIIPHIPKLWQFLAGILLPAPFALIWLFSKGKWMGLGDAKLMIGIGFLLGMSSGLTAILLSFWIGAAFSIALLLGTSCLKKNKRITFNTAIPFGPFLAIGTFITIVGSLDFTSIMKMFGGSY